MTDSKTPVELIEPPHEIKEKVGTGGLDDSLIDTAQTRLENNDIDFMPIADALLAQLDAALDGVKTGRLKGEEAIDALVSPAMQVKAQGSMFHHALATEIGNILVNFLETLTGIDDDALELVQAHQKAIRAVVHGKMTGDGGKMGKDLRDALTDACTRFYRSRVK
jgi:hypothetical protein